MHVDNWTTSKEETTPETNVRNFNLLTPSKSLLNVSPYEWSCKI